MGHCNCNHCHNEQKSKVSPYLLPTISFLMLLGGIALQVMEAEFFNQTIRLIWYVLAYLPVGLPVMKEAVESIREKDIFSEFTLMCIATLGAFYIGEYPEGVAVMLFYSIGELFQGNALAKARKNISALLDVRPETATGSSRREVTKRDCRLQHGSPYRGERTAYDQPRRRGAGRNDRNRQSDPPGGNETL